MIIRSILTGSAWRAYKDGCRELCGVKLPDGLKKTSDSQNQSSRQQPRPMKVTI